MRIEDTSGDHLVQFSCSEQVVQGHIELDFGYLERIKNFDFLKSKVSYMGYFCSESLSYFNFSTR